jgi:glycosyltransferase involved in cell wall biosynthesis
MQAWPDVLQRHPDARLVLVGDGPEREKLEHQAQALGLASSVEFTGFTERPMDYVKASAVFVLPSLIEGLPVALLEACAAGKPVIASRVGGIGEVIAHGVNGILVKAGRPSAIGRSINLMLANPQMMGSCGSKARKTIEEKFSFEKNLPRLEQFYHSVLHGERESAAGGGHTITDKRSDLCRE